MYFESVLSCRPGKEGVKKSVVASTSTRLIHRVPNQASVPSDKPPGCQQDQPGTEDQVESEEEEQITVREKTPDTNVKLNQPLRCGRYGQDLIPSKQHSAAAGVAQYQAPRLGAGGQANPALIASCQSTSAAPMVPKAAQAKLSNPKARVECNLLPPSVSSAVPQPRVRQTDGAVAKHPVQTASVAPAPADRAVSIGPAPASVDELLTGPVPRVSVMTASMAGAAAAMAESAAAMAGGTAADREAVKAALGHHYRQYRAKKAAAEERAIAAPPKPTATATAAADNLVGRARGNSDSAQRGEVPLRVKYGTSSSSGASSQAFTNCSQDSATSSPYGQQHPQQQHAQQPQQQHAQQHAMACQQQQLHQQAGHFTTWASQHQTASRIYYRHSSAAQAQKAEPEAQQGRQLHQQPQARARDTAGVQSAAPEDVEPQLGSAASEHDDGLRKSNEKLDMLLQSTVKRTQRVVSGKENKVQVICLCEDSCREPKVGFSEVVLAADHAILLLLHDNSTAQCAATDYMLNMRHSLIVTYILSSFGSNSLIGCHLHGTTSIDVQVLAGLHVAPKATRGNLEASKALRDYRH